MLKIYGFWLFILMSSPIGFMSIAFLTNFSFALATLFVFTSKDLFYLYIYSIRCHKNEDEKKCKIKIDNKLKIAGRRRERL